MSSQQTPHTMIGPGTCINGDLTFKGKLVIAGKIDGSVRGQGDLHIERLAVCKADIHAANLVVDGLVEGNISASESIQVNCNAKIVGLINAPKLAVAEGASMNSKCCIGDKARIPVADAPKPKPKQMQMPSLDLSTPSQPSMDQPKLPPKPKHRKERSPQKVLRGEPIEQPKILMVGRPGVKAQKRNGKPAQDRLPLDKAIK
jgi:cytoskeletal protein CcmA (bactofilin family)